MIFILGVGNIVLSVLFEVFYLIIAKIKWIRLESKMDREYGIRK